MRKNDRGEIFAWEYEDHINGLPYLLKYCKVKNLFFPLITTKDKIYLKLKALLDCGRKGFVFDFIENPYATVNREHYRYAPEIFQVVTEQDVGNFYGDRLQLVFSSENVAYTKLNWKCQEMYNWGLVPYNFRQTKRIEEFKEAIKDIFHINEMQIEERIGSLINHFPANKDKIKESYGYVSGDFNTNSLTLFSGMQSHRDMQYYAVSKLHPCWNCPGCRVENGCLYLGDYDASGKQKWNALRNAYNDYWEYIGCIQIPHHGSKYSYNEEISKLRALNVISAGAKNKYRHPHSAVVKDLILNDCKVHIVTENIGSQVDLTLYRY